MEKGTPIERTWICITFEGDAVVDWGDGEAQDLYTGDLLAFDESKYSHMATDTDLAMLQRAGRISAYDSRYVYLSNLPDRHLLTAEHHTDPVDDDDLSADDVGNRPAEEG